MISVVLPYPPSVNNYYKRNRNGGVRISDVGRLYRREVLCAVMTAKARNLLTCPISVTLEFNFPDNRRRDLDNLNKGLLDALQHAGVYEDDSQIHHLNMFRLENKAGGAVNVTITTIEEKLSEIIHVDDWETLYVFTKNEEFQSKLKELATEYGITTNIRGEIK